MRLAILNLETLLSSSITNTSLVLQTDKKIEKCERFDGVSNCDVLLNIRKVKMLKWLLDTCLQLL